MQITDTITSKNTHKAPMLEDIRQLVSEDFERVDALVFASLHSEVELIQKICQHIVQSGGKRLRPLLTLLSAKVFGYQGDVHVHLAVIIEFIHTATLLHDDVVDASSMRRGRPTANVVWGNQASILVGDFLYSRVFQLLTSLQHLPAMQILANTTNAIAQGEVLQLINRNNANVSEQHYLEVIRCKTAVLFAAATELGAVIAGRPSLEQQAMSSYGLHLGMAFQMIDDLLDYAVTAKEMGKNMGDDLADGKLTLPLIYAMQHGTEQQAQLIRTAIEQGRLEDLQVILEIVETTNAFDYVLKAAQKQADLAKQALAIFPNNPHKQALVDLAQLAVDRTS